MTRTNVFEEGGVFVSWSLPITPLVFLLYTTIQRQIIRSGVRDVGSCQTTPKLDDFDRATLLNSKKGTSGLHRST